MDNTDTGIPEEYKKRIRDKFELAAERGKWIKKGGKIVIEIDRPKPGRPQLIKALVILEDVSEI